MIGLTLLLTLLVVLWPKRVYVDKYIRRPAVLGIGWLVLLAIAVVVTVASVLLMPKPKGPEKPKASDLQDPTNDAGREMGVVFGEVVVKDGNFLWFGEKGVYTYKVKA